MKELEPLMLLEGRWRGTGSGSYGPFTCEMDVEQRGRWLLMRQTIRVPVVHLTTYVSTQVYGFDDAGLTLHFFDTAGAFVFHGRHEGDRLTFHYQDAQVHKTSVYQRQAGGHLAFDYESVEKPVGGADQRVHFQGVWEPAD